MDLKAIIVTDFGSPDVLRYVDMDIPVITPSQVLIRVEKTSVNYADVKSRYGKKGSNVFPFVPGLDAAGVIVEVGSEVDNLKIGQRVMAFPSGGSYSEYVAAEAMLTFELPDQVDFEMAAACPTVAFLSYKLLVDIARIEPGETILIHSASGGVGTTAIQLAKILGAGTIIGTVGSESKAAVAQHAGADHVFCYENEDFADKVNRITEGKGVQIVLDSVAGPITQRSLACLAPYGRLIQFGNSSGQPGIIQTSDLHSSCRSILGFSLGTTRINRPESLRHTAKQVLNYLKDGQLNIKISYQFPLEEAEAAHKLIESRLSTGKIVLDVKK